MSPTKQSVASAALMASMAVAAPAPWGPPQGGWASKSWGGFPVPTNSAQLSSVVSSLVAAATSAPVVSSFGPDSTIAYSQVPTVTGYPLRSSQVTGSTSHGAYSGTPTTTGAPMSGPAALSIGTLPPNPTATYYNANGLLTQEEPAPYVPAGGLGTNGTLPRYMVNSDFDFESIALGLYQEWIELDLFHNGLAVFSEQDFLDAGLTAEDRSYIEYMADQESGHATLLSNMLGEAAPPQCTYDYPFKTVREYVDFNQRLTRWGESGVWGFINHLDSREVAQLLAQSIATESRQQMSFRQMSGLHPMSVWFEAGIPQSWSWTYLAQYISSCPANTTRLAWQNFPQVLVVNAANINRVSPNDTADFEVTGRRIADPSISTIPANESCLNTDVTGYNCNPAISRNRSEPLSFAGKKLVLQWDAPGQAVGPNNSYVTATTAGTPQWVMWVNQLNATYTPLISTGNNTGYTFQPNGSVYGDGVDPIVNDTMFIALTDLDLYVTPFNLSMVNPHVVALGLYQAG